MKKAEPVNCKDCGKRVLTIHLIATDKQKSDAFRHTTIPYCNCRNAIFDALKKM
jgi:hypothetical protein